MAARPTEYCAYCGATDPETRDHIPPRGLFSKPHPQLITVPACKKCHDTETSKDDEYFRLALHVREGVCEHPEVKKIRPQLLRSLRRVYAGEGLKTHLRQNIALADVVSPNGVFIKRQWALNTDTQRLRRVVTRITKGLFYHQKHYRLPDNYDAGVFDYENFQRLSHRFPPGFNEQIIAPLLAQPAVTIGNGVFSYWFRDLNSDPHTTCWIFDFYQRVGFLGLTVPK